MPRQSKAQQDTVSREMHEFKQGELRSSAGRKVKDRKQAIAIGLHEAGASNQESPAKNRQILRKTKARERSGTRAEFYAEAKRRGVPGRSRATKSDLVRALGL